MVTGRPRRAMHQTPKKNTPRLNPPTGMTLVGTNTRSLPWGSVHLHSWGRGRAVPADPYRGPDNARGSTSRRHQKGSTDEPKKRVRPTASLKPVLASRNGHHLEVFPFFCYTGPQAGASFLKPKWVSKNQLLDNFFGLALAACRTFF